MAVDLAFLKQSLLQDTTTKIKNVQVNQRHLIDKILARYSAEFTVFRELLQNSNDAGAKSAQIIFLTDKDTAPKTSMFSFPWSKTSNVTTVIYKNNGAAFSDEDFARLRKIAEGNPDEQKIGFFGVGFYSLFSICEEPFVTSGSQSMAFLWNDDMLFTKHGTLPKEAQSEWTVFYLSMREPIDPPKAADFGRFLTTSLAFTSCLESIEVFIDSERILNFNKKCSIPRSVDIPNCKSVILKSPNNLFQLSTVSVSKAQLDVQVKNKQSEESYTIFMHIATADITSTLPRKLADEMKRTTKKNPPSTTQLRLMFSNYDEYDSSSGVRKGVQMFNDLMPDPSDQGRIFIGFPTHQTTGCAIQIAGHLIPTVERESIDFVDRSLKYWNQELLFMGGLLARIMYNMDLGEIETLYTQLSLDSESQKWLQKKAVHTMSAFTFKASTPSLHVSSIMRQAFYSMSKQSLLIVSSMGIRLASDVRLSVPEMLPFIKLTPLLPDHVLESCRDLVKQLQAGGCLFSLGLADVFIELRQRTFTITEVVALIKWWFKQLQSGQSFMNSSNVVISRADCITLKQILTMQDTPDSPKIAFANLTHFVRPNFGAIDLPFPDTVMPHTVSKHLSAEAIGFVFPDIKEFTIVDWLRYVTARAEFGTDVMFTEKCMAVSSKHYSTISETARAQLISILATKPCIPTQLGKILVPEQVYFSSVTLFKELPIATFTHPRLVSDAMLKTLGVREHVELQVVFDRLTDLNWDQVQLIKYLASVQTKLSSLEKSRLSATALFLGEAKNSGSTNGSESTAPLRRYRACDLFVPSDTLRTLGMPLLQWTVEWRSESLEAKFLKDLGLKEYVSIDNLIFQASTATVFTLRQLWIQYFIDNYETVYKKVYEPTTVSKPFLPIVGSTTLATPSTCFSNPDVAIMGFKVLALDLKPHSEKLGVRQSPTAQTIIDQLKKSPPTLDTAAEMFTFLGTQQVHFTNAHWNLLKSLPFIPTVSKHIPLVHSNTPAPITYTSPTDVYFKSAQDEAKQLVPFTYIDFGIAANAFLRTCGVKNEPSPIELAYTLAKSPHEFLDSSGIEVYLSLLRQVAANYDTLRTDSQLMKLMRSSAFLLGVKHGNDTDSVDDKTDEIIDSTKNDVDVPMRFKLAKASEIYLMDDAVCSQIFKPVCAPMEDILERMYQDLGSCWISQKVQLKYLPNSALIESPTSQKLQALINERAVLLLYDGHQSRRSKDLIPKAEKVLSNLQVLETNSINIVRTFQGVSRTQSTTACVVVKSTGLGNSTPILVIVNSFDHFDVATMIGRLVLRMPRLNDNLMLSTLLSSSIENLNRKGFPVDRILNLRASKLKIPSKAVVETSKHLSRDTMSQNNNSSESGSRTSLYDSKKIDSSPKRLDETDESILKNKVQELLSIFPDADPKFLYNRLRVLGVDNLQQIVGEMMDIGYPKVPPPYTPNNLGQNGDVGNNSLVPKQEMGPSRQNADNSSLIGMFNKFTGIDLTKNIEKLTSMTQQSRSSLNDQQALVKHAPTTDITPQETHRLKSQLKQSIATARPERNAAFRSTVPNDPTSQSTISKVQSQCNILTEHDLVLVMHTRVAHIPVYIDKQLASNMTAMSQQPLSEHKEAIHRFSIVLDFLSGVFKLQPGVVHMYWDKDGATIAFNRNRALFFNLRFYVGLHFQSIQNTAPQTPGDFPSSNSNSYVESVGNESCSVLSYWFMKFCHELAHNFVGEHNGIHEYWMSSFAETYFEPLIASMKKASVNFDV
ncbi:hypothetical protein BATDEDRAFT_24744 [Batrachochytrium dendrobatidis JAM81]|uniref:Sacsin/Nov domain-containing protein n=1 Tax=Batrachochytrium dendrobatidis (strain JAM81 / FGSC 10211) TaxID=684364 RepID=F4P294_BATDJ|nr:uncharacterized protein BATDEDRAFT_24744 [Batrachochytrium dendrobatidis JAM81]EGF81075.1 hypothetical protein BATDEDRAFT_24744 [Batrachochytrium dendrobatidis JAM81]|eukprot:XP_006678527.1 hypothetical protein BATDEDRAFT_24744 [Batrachochytrium dendrobatidis JAM81]